MQVAEKAGSENATVDRDGAVREYHAFYSFPLSFPFGVETV